MAKEAGISEARFQPLWQANEYDRCIGKRTLEEVLEEILRKNQCYSEQLFKSIVQKRIETKKDCFHHLHPEIIPMLSQLQERGFFIGLISNCFSEEA